MGLKNLLGIDKSQGDYEDDHEALLDQVLYTVPGTDTDITWADANQGTLMCGASGSGKSSGPGAFAAKSMLRNGFGFCVLCAKPDEAGRWIKYAQETGREKDLVLFNKKSGLSFNFLKYELERRGEGSGEIISAVNALMNINEQSRIHLSGGDGKEEPFWNNSLRRINSRAISLLVLADEEVSVSNMRKLVAGCFAEDEPNLYLHLKKLVTTEDNIDPLERQQAQEDLDNWVNSSYFLALIEKVSEMTFGSQDQQEEADMVLNYWISEFPRVPDKTSSTIIESFMGVIEPFMTQGILKEQFSSGLSPELLPENIIDHNSLVIVDFALKEYGLSAIFAATIFKSSFMAAMERRKIEQESNPKPVSLWIDEYQSFCSPMTDTLFQTTARSSWVATVYLTQNINNLYFVMGHNQPQARAKSLLGNLNLKYFASNACTETNKWASDQIGQHLTDFESLSIGKNMELSKSKNQRMQHRITPDHFTTLRTGRKINNYKVDTVVFKAGKKWGRDGQNFALVSFDQRA
ncbi:TraM recognition domain-containing protein [Reichenbachiella sp.]|uniref:type IV secretory system conjugative DNA transfer family protein n=1 Tax=Reichenbachiella sp. TaxID=2184521 RepID=UPI003297095D